METMNTKFIMSRLLDNPRLRKLKLSSAASYIKDFASINGIEPIAGHFYAYCKIVDYKGPIPLDCNKYQVEDMYLCNTELNALFSENDRLSASLKTSKVPNTNKVQYGSYNIKSSTVFVDFPDGVLEIFYKGMEVDELGFPVLPYHGALAEAVTNYVKYRYYKLLWENDMISYNKVEVAHREYTWYIGQYTSEHIIPTYDEAVSWANSWQRLLNDRNLDLDDKPFTQILNF